MKRVTVLAVSFAAIAALTTVCGVSAASATPAPTVRQQAMSWITANKHQMSNIEFAVLRADQDLVLFNRHLASAKSRPTPANLNALKAAVKKLTSAAQAAHKLCAASSLPLTKNASGKLAAAERLCPEGRGLAWAWP